MLCFQEQQPPFFFFYSASSFAFWYDFRVICIDFERYSTESLLEAYVWVWIYDIIIEAGFSYLLFKQLGVEFSWELVEESWNTGSLFGWSLVNFWPDLLRKCTRHLYVHF